MNLKKNLNQKKNQNKMRINFFKKIYNKQKFKINIKIIKNKYRIKILTKMNKIILTMNNNPKIISKNCPKFLLDILKKYMRLIFKLCSRINNFMIMINNQTCLDEMRKE